MSTPQQALKVKRIIWTGAIASVTVVGTIYGAGLKTRGEQKQQVRKIREATLSERIAHLEEQRGVLVGKRMGLEKKIEEARMRRNGATVEESTRGMERKRGEAVGPTMGPQTPRVTVEDNLRVVGIEAEVEEGRREERKEVVVMGYGI
ncbi:24eec512-a183-49ad-8d81-c4f829fa7ba5 [Sclerotinia trifoliorum]|uniref:24eec512-a183-49ad-8d81-c4f829fa7ba5 n=1 Tax=Sclerotinia trifoliorum TaxID=28548 RepID=A0A8H2VWX1_9HELO|nr:24eec512-a183-49ad-8d81-c4f829fa7ba5 [Sclerotinia trifoliorum]